MRRSNRQEFSRRSVTIGHESSGKKGGVGDMNGIVV